MNERKIGVKNRGNAGKGRPKGALNKVSREVKEMVVEALERAGGVDYLVEQARNNPGPFLTLVGKIVPLQMAGRLDHAVKIAGALQWKPPQ